MTLHPNESILIVDFGSQVTQLIARRVREAGVYSEIAPFNAADEAFERLKPKGIILSGGPSSVMWDDSPRAPQHFFDAGMPILAICYGQQTMAHQLGGVVAASDNREFGRAFIDIIAPSALFDGLWDVGEKHQVWMSHGDRVEQLPDGFSIVAKSEGAPYAIATDEAAPLLFDDVPPRGRAHARRRQAAGQFRAPRLRLRRRLDDGELPRCQDRRDPRPGRQWPGDLRAVGRGRQRGCGGADPRSDRRAIDLRLRRSRADAVGRGGAGRVAVPQQLQHPAGPRRREQGFPRRAGRGHRPGSQAQIHRPDVHRRVRGRGQKDRRRRFPRPGHALSRRHRERVSSPAGRA